MTTTVVIRAREKADAALERLLPDEDWAVYEPVIRAALARGLRFAIGGGVAFSLYAGHARWTKDLDVFIVPPDHVPFMQLLAEHGFVEFNAVPYDRSSSYRSVKDGHILDVLWNMLSDARPHDEHWVARGWELQLKGLRFQLIPPEELIWSKLYIVHRDRCDWPDILAVIYSLGPVLDWPWLLDRLQGDSDVLGGPLALFRWLCPGRAAELPAWIWERAGLAPRMLGRAPRIDVQRARRLRGEGWFPPGDV